MSPLAETNADGRRARSERSREAIKKAMIDLMIEGVHEPTAQQVSDRAGIGIRSVFRHFDDMESLFYSIHKDLLARDRQMTKTVKQNGTAEERLDSLLDAMEGIFDTYRDVILGTLGLMWKHEALQETYADLNSRFRRLMFRTLHELKTAPEADQNLAEMLISFECRHRLIRHQGLSPEDAKAIIRKQILPLLKA